LAKKKIKKKVKKVKRKPYFGIDVQEAIVRYNAEDNPNIRNQIYRDEIAYAFDKLCENIINTFKFSYFDSHFEDIKNEVISFLVLNIHKYDATKGFKAFSYFSVVAKNYLILLNNGNYKKLKMHDSIQEKSYTVNKIRYYDDHDSGSTVKSDLAIEIVNYFEDKIDHMFKHQRDKAIAYALVDLFKEENEIKNFTKKSMYVLVREMTNENTARITKVVNEFKKRYKKIVQEFYTRGTLTHLL
jgi:hypothetical protein